MGLLNKSFTGVLKRSPSKGGWTYVVMPGSAEFFKTPGTGQDQRNRGRPPFQSSFMALGDGTHKLPVKASLRTAIGKEAGGRVEVRLTERIED